MRRNEGAVARPDTRPRLRGYALGVLGLVILVLTACATGPKELTADQAQERGQRSAGEKRLDAIRFDVSEDGGWWQLTLVERIDAGHRKYCLYRYRMFTVDDDGEVEEYFMDDDGGEAFAASTAIGDCDNPRKPELFLLDQASLPRLDSLDVAAETAFVEKHVRTHSSCTRHLSEAPSGGSMDLRTVVTDKESGSIELTYGYLANDELAYLARLRIGTGPDGRTERRFGCDHVVSM